MRGQEIYSGRCYGGRVSEGHLSPYLVSVSGVYPPPPPEKIFEIWRSIIGYRFWCISTATATRLILANDWVYLCDFISMLCLCYEHDVRLSVRLSVCITAQQKSWNRHLRGDWCLGHMHAEADPDRILWSERPNSSLESQSQILHRKTSVVWKHVGVLHFGGMRPTARTSRYISACSELFVDFSVKYPVSWIRDDVYIW